MSFEERLDKLEERLSDLEKIVSQLAIRDID